MENPYPVEVEDYGQENVDNSDISSLKYCKSCSSILQISDEILVQVCQACGSLQTKMETSLVCTADSSNINNRVSSEDNIQNGFKYRKFLAKVCCVCNVLKLPAEVIDQITTLADRSFRDQQLKRMKLGARIASCIYYVTRKQQCLNMTFSKLSYTVQIPVHGIYKCLRMFIKRLDLEPLPFISYVTHLENISSYVPRASQQDLIECAMRIESVVKIINNGTGMMPAAVALLKIAADAKGTPYKLKKLCEDTSIGEAHIGNLTRVIRKSLFAFAEKIPWQPKGLTFRNITKFIPEILRYHEKFGDENDEEISDTEDLVDSFKEKLQFVIKMRREGKSIEKMENGDPVLVIIQELLDKGCTEEEILNHSLGILSKKYLDYVNENDYSDEEIPDEDIDLLLKDDVGTTSFTTNNY